MKRVNKNSLIMLILAFVAAVTSIFAYFILSTPPASDEVKVSPSFIDVYANIESENDLRIGAYDTVFLSKGVLNDSTVLIGGQYVPARKIVRLLKNITLTSDLTIEADINLDLNSFTLDLNGYTLTFRHNYISNLTIFGGTIADGSVTQTSKLYIELPNAEFFAAADFICNVPKIFVYDFTKVAEEVNKYLQRVIGNYCVDDLPLVLNYKHYPITFKYESSVPAVMDEYGRVKRAGSDTYVLLTLTVSDGTQTQTYEYSVTVLGSSSSALGQLGKELVNKYFSRYKYTDTDAGDWFVNPSNGYMYYNNISLIGSDAYLGVEFTYEILVGAESPVAVTDMLQMREQNGSFTLLVRVWPLGNTIGTALETIEYEFYSCNNYDIAKNALYDVGAVVFETEMDEILVLPASFKDLKNVLSVSVAFSRGNEGGNFILVTNSTTGEVTIECVAAKGFPSYTTHVYLEYTFTFKSGAPTVITKEIRVYVYDPSSSGSIGLTGYDRLYYLLLQMLRDNEGQIQSLSSFELPSVHSRSTIRYEFIIDPAVLLKYPYAAGIILPPTEQDEVFTFSFNQICIPPTSVPVIVKLYFDDAEESYEKVLSFEIPGVLRCTRPEGYTPEILDPDLYAAMLANFDTNGDQILLLNEVIHSSATAFTIDGGAGRVSLSSLKGIDYMVTVKDFRFLNTIFEPGCLSGLNTLIDKSKINRLQFNNCDLTSDDLAYLSNMPYLTYLDLSHNKITDLSKMPTLPAVTHFDISDNLITTYDNIGALYSTRVLIIDADISRKVLLQPLANLRVLNEVHMCGVTVSGSPVPMSSAFHTVNFVRYVTMYSVGVRFFYNSVEVAAPSSDEIKAAAVLDSYIYFSESRTIILSMGLPAGSTPTHILNWASVNGETVTNITGGTTMLTVTGGTATVAYNSPAWYITITPAVTGNPVLTFQVTVTVGTATMMREIYIKVN